MPAELIRRTIVLGPAAHELRRHVGPTAWVVLEEMLQRSSTDVEVTDVEVSVRALAASLELAKDTVARDADNLAHTARLAVDERDEQRAANQRRYLNACRDLPAAEAAHAPVRQRVVDAKDVVTEARSNLWNAERDLRNVGKLGRRSARRGVEAENDVLAVAEERLARCEQAAEPTKRPLSELRDIVDYHDRIQSTRDMLDDWTNLDARADRAERVCDSLDRWRYWANGHSVPVGQLRHVIAVLEDDRTINGTNQLAEATRQWAQEAGVDLPRPPVEATRPLDRTRSRTLSRRP